MAPQAELDIRLDVRLEALRALLADLPEVARDWPHLTDAERTSWSLDWDQIMGALGAVLDPAYRGGTMPDEQRSRYREALAGLRAALPCVRTLKLAVPKIPLDI